MDRFIDEHADQDVEEVYMLEEVVNYRASEFIDERIERKLMTFFQKYKFLNPDPDDSEDDTHREA
jgi:hypothetical protein